MGDSDSIWHGDEQADISLSDVEEVARKEFSAHDPSQTCQRSQTVRKAGGLIAFGGTYFLLSAKSNGINSPPLSTKETLGFTCTT